jgi:hypothetical protein
MTRHLFWLVTNFTTAARSNAQVPLIIRADLLHRAGFLGDLEKSAIASRDSLD